MKRKYLILFSLSGLIVACDQWTKLWVSSHFELGDRHTVLDHWLFLIRSHNTHFGFSVLEGAPAYLQEFFFIGVPVFALLLILLIFIKLQNEQMLTSVALSTILAGAVSNLVDRLVYGYVIDFIELQLNGSAVFPLFNLADLSILSGVFLMFLSTILQGGGKRE